MSELVDWARQIMERGLGQAPPASERQANQVSHVVGSLIWWRAASGRLEGPALVEQVTQRDGQIWVWVTHQGIGRWLNRVILTRIEPQQADPETQERR